MKRTFNYAEYVRQWRALAADHGLDARTGEPLPVAGRPWWVHYDLFAEIGDNASVVEAEALSNIAAEVRRIAGVPEAQGVDYAIRPSVRAEIASLAEDGAGRMVQLPLREIHRRQGVVVEEVLGVRMTIPIKAA